MAIFSTISIGEVGSVVFTFDNSKIFSFLRFNVPLSSMEISFLNTWLKLVFDLFTNSCCAVTISSFAFSNAISL